MEKTIYEYEVIIGDGRTFTILADEIQIGEGVVLMMCEEVCVFTTTDYYTIINRNRWQG